MREWCNLAAAAFSPRAKNRVNAIAQTRTRAEERLEPRRTMLELYTWQEYIITQLGSAVRGGREVLDALQKAGFS